MNIQKFLKRYGYFCLAGLLVIALGLTVVLASVSGGTKMSVNSANNPVVSVGGSAKLTFTLPMDNPSVIKDYNGTGLSWNATLSWWEAHEGVDLISDNSKVYAIADGTVIAVTEDGLEGAKIILEHENGLQSIYSSLSTGLNLSVGNKVSKGDHLGNASSSAGIESGQGAHLHFELVENGKKIE